MTRVAARFPADTAPVVAFAATTATALLAAPAIASRLASQFGLSPSEIGFYFSVEQAGMCLASLPAMWWLNRVAWRRVAAIAMGAFILANLISTQITAFGWLLPIRGVSALSGGTLMVLSMTLAGRSADRERLFALWTLGQLVVGASLLYVLPRVFATFGLAFLYALIAGLMAANLPLLRRLSNTVQIQTTEPLIARPSAGHSESPRLPARTHVCGVGGVLFYYLGFGGLWPFLAAIGQTGGGSVIGTGTVLALAGLSGLAGALLAAVLARHAAWRTLAFGYALHAAALSTLLGHPELARFAAAACLLKGASNFSLPFILGNTARLDSHGRLMGFTNMAIGGGLAIGPLIAGGVIEISGSFDALIALTFVWIAASACLVLVSLTQARTSLAHTAASEPA